MSLMGALNVGRSALAVQQAAIQVTGNNISNAGNAGYTRQTATLTPTRDQQLRPGVFLGTGVDLSAVSRQIDEALESRLRASFSDTQSAQTTEQWLGRVESVLNELGDDDLSTRLSSFFTSWSTLANRPQDIGLRQVVLQNGDATAHWLNDLHAKFTGLNQDVGSRLVALTRDADGLSQQIADLNRQISTAEGGTNGGANGLRDQRDAALKKLAELVDVRTVPQSSGGVNVYIGSEPLVLGTQSRGIGTRQETIDGQVVTTAVIKQTGAPLGATGGQLAGLADAAKRIDAATNELNTVAGGLIFELNKIHSSGQGLEGFERVTGSNAALDPTAALNSAAAGLAFKPQNGSFVVHVKQKATGLVTSTLVQVDLDGQGSETTLNSLKSDIDAITGITATINGGKLNVTSDSKAVEISFSQDSSGALAALGVNNFYSGRNAKDIAVSDTIRQRPALLAAAKNGEPTDNQTAVAIAGLENASLQSLSGTSLKDAYQSMVDGVAASSAAAKTSTEAAQQVQETLESQREGLSGVSLDEEAVNLMRQQRAFQGAARLVSVVDELMQQVLNLK